MEVAEKEITAALARYPADPAAVNGERALERERMNGSFAVLFPGELGKYSADLYRAHARELIERARVGEDTRPGTKAEVLAGLLEASLKAPLNRGGQALAEGLCRELFPLAAFVKDFDAREAYAGESAELLRDARRRCASLSRVMP